MWVPRFACPECRGSLIEGDTMHCGCGQTFSRVDSVYRFLSKERRAESRQFAAQYGRVRDGDGHRAVVSACWRTLPHVPRTHPGADEWRIRSQSWDEFVSRVLTQPRRRLLDLGAGCGWLSSRCASMGHRVVAVDRFDDESDAAAMRLHDGPAFVVVQADFEALPFEPAQVDVAVFNASLHYAKDPDSALAKAALMLSPGGVLVVMDSPMFKDAADGEAMVGSQLSALSAAHRIEEVVRPGAGFLTFDGLNNAAKRLGRCTHFIPSRGSIARRVRRGLAPFRLGRAPASFGLWVAQ